MLSTYPRPLTRTAGRCPQRVLQSVTHEAGESCFRLSPSILAASPSASESRGTQVTHPEPGSRIVLENRLSRSKRLKLATATTTRGNLAVRNGTHVPQLAGCALAHGDSLVDTRLVIAKLRPGTLYAHNGRIAVEVNAASRLVWHKNTLSGKSLRVEKRFQISNTKCTKPGRRRP
jgi:hypothetical protein